MAQDPALELQVEKAFEDFRAALDAGREHLARVAATPVHTPEERAELDRDARSGALGPQMKEIAERVQAGETSWGEVFEGTSVYSDLLVPHLERMEAEHAEEFRVALEADPEFDPEADVQQLREEAGPTPEDAPPVVDPGPPFPRPTLTDGPDGPDEPGRGPR